ncbi:Serine/Threonine kinase domain protein (macronuclear) [Tetrahymena thermophila SB210]|uniref:non-specific serine/threonine protein kinase n=1 Tax=Tetrahymena thermophila (strain SB210) TaxID=312017 RepID=X1W3S7_TETTS|nr:Serine/Threonine kinase domain protein [Tetrahymena thermophila SB210]EDK31484.1 Serine/Threonine kinase domain protein [Tetrahymena thermophila SB210]|eukprot:XP_001470948.1 Serine/Threonine kinase domain protein [Tetrahymena thermophila SB210]
MENYEVIGEIGAGQFGKVVKIKRKSDNKILVWKQLEYGKMDEKEKSQLVAEVNILREIRHPNVVRYYDRIIDKQNQHIYIIMEYCEGGDLAAFLKNLKKEKETIPEEAIWRIFMQIVLALHEIHHKKIMHRDLKPANIFLDSKNNAKLGDFGLSKKLSDETKFAYTNVGTPYYMSPEQIEENKYNEKSDIWACGCLLYELGALSPPFPATNHLALAMKIKNGKFERLSKQYSDELMRVISWCLQKNSENRPSVDDLLNLPQISMRLREKRLKENQSVLKQREDDASKKEETLNAMENSVKLREDQFTKQQEEIQSQMRVLEEKKSNLLLQYQQLTLNQQQILGQQLMQGNQKQNGSNLQYNLQNLNGNGYLGNNNGIQLSTQKPPQISFNNTSSSITSNTKRSQCKNNEDGNQNFFSPAAQVTQFSSTIDIQNYSSNPLQQQQQLTANSQIYFSNIMQSQSQNIDNKNFYLLNSNTQQNVNDSNIDQNIQLFNQNNDISQKIQQQQQSSTQQLNSARSSSLNAKIKMQF